MSFLYVRSLFDFVHVGDLCAVHGDNAAWNR